MRVCDRHPELPAVTTAVLADTQERFDVCVDCSKEIHEFFLGVEKKLPPKPEPEPVRPTKRSILGLKL